MDLLSLAFEAAWHLSKAPLWLGWLFIGGAVSALCFLAGRVL